ncbi:MAG TPA: REJ domain-containing protein, partial [Flavisolibacter sp.]|nr:REJ domain-containing protein [Flavisolibacter sp.]
THNQDDPTVSVSNTTGWVNLINQYGGNIISTIFPVSGHDAWTKTYDPNFTQNGVNIYQWMLQHQRGNSVTPTNQPPVVNAGNNQTITLPQNSATLTGTASDADGSISSYFWTQTSGPSTATIASASAASTTVSNLVQGVYIFSLKVTDNGGATASSTVTIAVTAGTSNATPGASAGANQIITLPQNSTSLNGSGTDTDGYIAFYEWSQTSGPSTASFSSLYSANPVVSGLVLGSYVFTLKVTDNSGATATSSVTITVNAAPNQAPAVSAGSNQTITLPQNSVTLSGSASDADGSIASYQWSQTSGPSTANIVSASSASSVVNNLVLGSYVFTLKVTDNSGATATSSVTITVNAAPNQAPAVSAGSNQTITLPQNSVTLSGTASDADGSIASYQWSQTSGPSTANILSASSASSVVNNLVLGSYVFTLKVTDNSGATATSSVTITVNAAPNQAPAVSAGSNQTITLPQNSVTLSGTASDADGSIASYQWSQTSGPSKAIYSSPSPSVLSVRNLSVGVYTFRLTVIDNDGATAWSEVNVTVVPNPTNQSTASLYPNPATDIVYLRIDAVTLQTNSLITIVNSAGNTVYNEKFMRTDFRVIKEVNVSTLPRGTYFLTITTDINNTKTLPFIKQ